MDYGFIESRVQPVEPANDRSRGFPRNVSEIGEPMCISNSILLICEPRLTYSFAIEPAIDHEWL
jgi:hypothetical protein